MQHSLIKKVTNADRLNLKNKKNDLIHWQILRALFMFNLTIYSIWFQNSKKDEWQVAPQQNTQPIPA